MSTQRVSSNELPSEMIYNISLLELDNAIRQFTSAFRLLFDFIMDIVPLTYLLRSALAISLLFSVLFLGFFSTLLLCDLLLPDVVYQRVSSASCHRLSRDHTKEQDTSIHISLFVCAGHTGTPVVWGPPSFKVEQCEGWHSLMPFTKHTIRSINQQMIGVLFKHIIINYNLHYSCVGGGGWVSPPRGPPWATS